MTVCMVISLLEIPYTHCIYMCMYGSGQAALSFCLHITAVESSTFKQSTPTCEHIFWVGQKRTYALPGREITKYTVYAYVSGQITF